MGDDGSTDKKLDFREMEKRALHNYGALHVSQARQEEERARRKKNKALRRKR